MGRRHRGQPGRDGRPRRIGARSGPGRYRLRRRTGPRLCARTARFGSGFRDDHAVRAAHRAEMGAVQRCGLLCAHGPLCPYRLCRHVGRHSQGRRGQDRDRLFHAVSRRRDASVCSVCDARSRGRYRHDAGRCASHRHDGVWAVHRQTGGRDRWARQQVRGRSQTHAVRQGRHRRVRRPVRGRHPRGSHRRPGNRRGRPAGAGRTRARIPRVAVHRQSRAGRNGDRPRARVDRHMAR